MAPRQHQDKNPNNNTQCRSAPKVRLFAVEPLDREETGGSLEDSVVSRELCELSEGNLCGLCSIPLNSFNIWIQRLTRRPVVQMNYNLCSSISTSPQQRRTFVPPHSIQLQRQEDAFEEFESQTVMHNTCATSLDSPSRRLGCHISQSAVDCGENVAFCVCACVCQCGVEMNEGKWQGIKHFPS